MTTSSKGIELEKRVSDALKRFDTAVRASTSMDSSLDDIAVARKNHRVEAVEDIAKRIAAEPDGEAPRATPRCRPWDYKDFRHRLKTFTSLKWFAKPFSASPPMCARFGWVNQGRDTLVCECCGAELQYSEQKQAPQNESQDSSRDDSAEVEVSPPAPFLSRLSSQHHDLCPWKGNVCPKEFLQLPPVAGEDWRRDFLLRFKTVLPLNNVNALPEAALPSNFEEHCPGGFGTLAEKTRQIISEENKATANTTGDDKESNSVPAEPSNVARKVDEAQSSRKSSMGGAEGNGNKRQRRNDGPNDYGNETTLGGLDVSSIGAAAAIATFGWQSVSTPSLFAGNGNKDNAANGEGLVPAADEKHRLRCAVCNRRLLTDNFLAVESGESGDAPAAAGRETTGSSPPPGGVGGGRGTKRRRLSGGGTPLKPMDLVGEHRSFCPWAMVHPDVEGEARPPGALPGWRKALEAVVSWDKPSILTDARRREQSDEVDGDVTDKAKEALEKVQRVLNVLIRY